jgi:membrane-bound lytic murein transglycosylase F
MIKRLLLIILITVVLLACENNNSKKDKSVNDLPAIEKRGKLRVITDYNSNSYFIYRGTPMGFQYDLLEIVAKELDLDLEIKVSNNLVDAFEKLESETCDLLAINLNITNDRKEFLKFTTPLGTSRQVLVQRKPDNWQRMADYNIEKHLIRNQLDLSKKQVYVRENSAFAARLNNLSNEIGDTIFIEEVEYYATEQLISLVSKGEIDYVVAEEYVAKFSQSYYPNIDIETAISFPQQYAWAVKPESEALLEKINSWLEQFKKTAHFAVIYNKYYKTRSATRRTQSDYISVTGGKISDYDELIKKYAKTIDWDWRLLASLIYQESRFNPNIKSWAGAYGLMQLMPATAKQFGASKNSSPEVNIKAGIKFIQWLDKRFETSVPDKNERIKFILGSYNAGMGHINDARRLAEANGRDPKIWTDNVDYFILNKSNPEYYDSELVKYGHLRGVETFNYVKDIMDRYEVYKTVIQ